MYRRKNKCLTPEAHPRVLVTTGHGIAFNCQDSFLHINSTSFEEGKWLVTVPLTCLIWFNHRRQNNQVAAWFYIFHRHKVSSVMHGWSRLCWKPFIRLFGFVCHGVNKWLYISWWFPVDLNRRWFSSLYLPPSLPLPSSLSLSLSLARSLARSRSLSPFFFFVLSDNSFPGRRLWPALPLKSDFTVSVEQNRFGKWQEDSLKYVHFSFL